jgi:hypothetical protein
LTGRRDFTNTIEWRQTIIELSAACGNIKMQKRSENQADSLEDELMAATAKIAPQFRHLLLEIALQLGERHPNVVPNTQPKLLLVKG